MPKLTILPVLASAVKPVKQAVKVTVTSSPQVSVTR